MKNNQIKVKVGLKDLVIVLMITKVLIDKIGRLENESSGYVYCQYYSITEEILNNFDNEDYKNTLKSLEVLLNGEYPMF